MNKKEPYISYGHGAERQKIKDIPEDYLPIHYGGITTFRRRQMRLGMCCCPKKHWLECDMDCLNCPYRTSVGPISLDNLVDKNQEATYVDLVVDPASDVEDAYKKEQLYAALHRELAKLDPDSLIICRMYMQRMSKQECAQMLNISRDQLRTKEQRLFAELRRKLGPYYCY